MDCRNRRGLREQLGTNGVCFLMSAGRALFGVVVLLVSIGCNKGKNSSPDASLPDPRTVSHFIDEIPVAETSKYSDGTPWMNPELIVSRDGVLVTLGRATARKVPVSGVVPMLLSSPATNWPYGRVVRLSESGILASAQDASENRKTRTLLQQELQSLGIRVEPGPPPG